jgi:hypothetical protein
MNRTLSALFAGLLLSRAAAGIAADAAPAEEKAKPALTEGVNLWGYGEIYYAHPTHHDELTQADLARAVFGIGYQFDERTRFDSEFEVEHAVASADDPGEFEVEQFYVHHRLSQALSLRAGLFLIPAGLLNEHHEPTAFYGMQRNFVETLIIPSTWREGGFTLQGTTHSGFTWDIGLTTGLNLSAWDFLPEGPQYSTALDLANNGVAPMQATHQELALASAQHLSQFAALNYRTPGLNLGASIFTGKVVPVANVDDQRVTLWEGHARYQPGRWDFSAVYAHGSLTHTEAANLQFPGTPNPIPATFDGWYVQAACKAWEKGSVRVSPFARYERYDMGASYDGIAPGFPTTPSGLAPTDSGSVAAFAIPRDNVLTVGGNLYLTSGVVFKLDYQSFRKNTDFSRFDVGLGLSF